MVLRPRLMERLRDALNCGLVLVSAPAGFGKTTFVSEWVRQIKAPTRTAWVSLDEGDNDPVLFWHYFIAALKTIQPTAGEKALTLLHSPQAYPAESMLKALINDMTTTQDDFVLVLDDYHLIKSDAIHSAITFLLDHLPPKMHLVIASRVDPSLPLSRFRGRGTLLEIGDEDLRFTLDEAAQLMSKLQDLEITARDLSILNAKTEGWAVGLKMAALSIREHKDIAEFVAMFSGSQRYVGDYLIEEVLQRQPEELRDFLLKASVLERLSAPLCDYVTEMGGSQETLVKLEQANLFLFMLDDSRHWFRYQHLFAELLRHQLETASKGNEISALHQRASQWFEDNKYPNDAIQHALAARDWERAMRLIGGIADSLIKMGQWKTLFDWLQVIPEENLRTQPSLYAQYVNVVITYSRPEAGESALANLARVAQEDASLQGEVAFFQGIIARRKGDTQRVMEMGKRALELLPPDKLAMRARASFYLAGIHLGAARLEEARSFYTDAFEMARQVADYWIAAGAAGALGLILWYQGEAERSAACGTRSSEPGRPIAGGRGAPVNARHRSV